MSQPWSAIDYVELHCHSSFSLLDGASAPAELIARAGDLGMDALALTDHDALYGAIPFVTAARARGIRFIVLRQSLSALGRRRSLSSLMDSLSKANAGILLPTTMFL